MIGFSRLWIYSACFYSIVVHVIQFWLILFQQALEMEIKRLDDLIDETEKQETLAIHLCRRGAVYRKVGLILDVR